MRIIDAHNDATDSSDSLGTGNSDVHVEPELHPIALPINVTPMRYVNDPHDHPVVEYLVDHPKFASPC